MRAGNRLIRRQGRLDADEHRGRNGQRQNVSAVSHLLCSLFCDVPHRDESHSFTLRGAEMFSLSRGGSGIGRAHTRALLPTRLQVSDRFQTGRRFTLAP